MKTFFLSFTLVINSLTIVSAQRSFENKTTMTVYNVSKKNLPLYEQANEKSKVLAEIPSLENLELTEPSKTATRVKQQNISGQWRKVRYSGKEGFVFDGFLSALPKPRMKNGQPAGSLSDFVHELSEVQKKSTSKVKSWSGQTETYIETDSTFEGFKNGMSLIQKENGKLGFVSLIIPNTSVEEVLLWSLHFGLEIENFNYAKPKNKEVVAIDDAGINYYFDFKYDKQKQFSLIKMTRGSEGGSISASIEYNKNKQVCLTLIDDFQ